MLELVSFEVLNEWSSVPKILVIFGRMKSMLECQLVNKVLIHWQVATAMKKIWKT